MDYKAALDKGFMKLSDKELDEILGDLFNEENPQTQLDRGLDMLMSFIPEEKVDAVLDLAYIIHEAYYELGKFDEEVDEEEEEFEMYDDEDDED